MKNFIIFSNGYDEKNGGVIVLHLLCHLLNQQGQKAFLWPAYKPIFDFKSPLKSILKYFKYFKKSIRRPYQTAPDFTTPIAKKIDLYDAICLYPEIVDGNPLMAKNIVRWFLHKPGFHSNKINYGENELYFFYQHIFNDTSINPNSDHLLRPMLIRDDLYFQTNFASRTGSCTILRKGKHRKIVNDLTQSIIVDEMPHEELANIFNHVKYCISYDMHTLYLQYAALCGCIPVVIAEDGVSKEEWQPNENFRFGVAYGFEDIDYAIQTQHLVLPFLQSEIIAANQSVSDFIIACQKHFS